MSVSRMQTSLKGFDLSLYSVKREKIPCMLGNGSLGFTKRRLSCRGMEAHGVGGRRPGHDAGEELKVVAL